MAPLSARLLDPASITLPLLGRDLDAAGIAAAPDLSRRLRDALRSPVAAAERRPGLVSAPAFGQS